MTAMPSLRRVNALYTMVQLTYWAAFAGYQTALLLGRGFSSGEAGAFAAIRCLAGILAQPLLGGWADRHPKVPLKHILRLCLAVSLAVNGVFYCTRPGFWGTALIFLALGVLELNAYPRWIPWPCQFINAGRRSITAWGGAWAPSPTQWPAWLLAGRARIWEWSPFF